MALKIMLFSLPVTDIYVHIYGHVGRIINVGHEMTGITWCNSKKKANMNITKRMIIMLGIAILFMDAQYLIAGEPPNSKEIIKEASNNISEEFVTCAAFYSIAAEGLRRSGHLEDAAKMDKARNAALEYALISAKEGRTIEMAKKVTMARLELNMKSMTNEINNDIGNISILINEYAGCCKEIMENPDKMMAEWADKIIKKHVTK
jgi:hypothetical protein